MNMMKVYIDECAQCATINMVSYCLMEQLAVKWHALGQEEGCACNDNKISMRLI
jgi:hypothetical protein